MRCCCCIPICFCLWITLWSVRAFEHDDEAFNGGLFPNIINLAAQAVITSNATCGESGSEVYCKLVEHVLRQDQINIIHSQQSPEPQCGVCDAASSEKQHPVSYAIDGTNRHWQSPTLQNGKQFEWVTLTLDLGQIYQVAYIIVKAATSPRPGNWILEKSLDGILYTPWQYYAISDSECWETYGIRPTIGKPAYHSDEEVICTSYYSKLEPLENGEIHTSLVNGRPGADGPSRKLMEFTKARYVRLRFQKIRTLNADLMSLQTDDPDRMDITVTRRYFYSVKDISVGGQCMCSGHASNCSYDRTSGRQHCLCKHHTCGNNCEKCCPMFNQDAFQPGTSLDAALCKKCECFGHSESCHFDAKIAADKKSINAEGKYEGGGVCDNCKHHTSGINCEKCEDGYFRPLHISKNLTKPCRKCQCAGPGMTGICVKDISEGLPPGQCLCKTGFEGPKCDRCSIGYRNYPLCEPCPCYSAGTLGKICEGTCVCKAHVEGSRCDRCKRGFYHLSADNPDGCSQCFCFGLTDECVEGDWGVNVVQKIEEWRVTDLKGRKVVKAFLELPDAVIANDDMSQFSNYYWLAPPDYLGKKLYSYGADLKFSISYVVARGDTSGTYTESADVVLEGNGMQIGYNFAVRPELDSMTITMPLRETGWFTIDKDGKPGSSVSRETFTLVLNDLTRLMIRAKFHTDQIEGRLHDVGMETAAEGSESFKRMNSVEKCICPPGYAGLSCEVCASGYRAVKDETSLLGFTCEPCNCYNHAETCDDAGRCINCLHHTTGRKCERCIHGYYGNATIGTENDCKRCACPLEESENNFSPSCIEVQFSTSGEDYLCDQCAHGYQGQKCESCSDGYFGNPKVSGGFCKPCDCSGNADTSQPGWCDGLTGQCHKCLGNTGGWNCGECLPGHYGNSERRSCKPCSCNVHGSLSPQCDEATGQCICKSHFIGRTCDRCADGYGNVEAGCTPCKCNQLGSRSETCDQITGHCLCKPGVFGTTCDYCQENFYGFSHHGCRECSCDPYGSVNLQCDENHGQCRCKNHVIGKTCDRCEDGYWNIRSVHGCVQCHCNRTGSQAALCNKDTGQCTCKPGTGGDLCDQCLPGYFKFTSRGCRKCDPCDIPGHICDPNNGRCVCPPFTTGRTCQNCVPNSWDYDPLKGCKLCDCNAEGSPSQRCDPNNGQCLCLEGFEGKHCDQCRHGYYNFPKCHKCDCSAAGTESSYCQAKEGVCKCNDQGHCICKEHVTGKKCNKCQEDSFGLSSENAKGCHKCFCFGRTRICNQANMHWRNIQFPTQDIFTEVGTSEIPSVLGFRIIPSDLQGRKLGIPYVLDQPLYWNLPKENLGDKVLSYNGYLSFHTESHSASHFPEALLQAYPLVILQGNQRIILVHSHSAVALRRQHRIKIHESEWRYRDNPNLPVTKDVLMVCLQNLQTVLIRATDGPDVKYSRIYNVSIDEAHADVRTQASVAEGVEVCRCPRQYIGSSCQDPAPGYYRKRKPNYLDSKDILDLVGWAEPCSCNNHTNVCDPETGICINCAGNTMGDHCDRCKRSFYGDPARGPCRPCSCPHPKNTFSDTCIPDSLDYICVDCQSGYTGRHCERCDKGYYGNPQQQDGRCIECKCNPYGSVGKECDAITGQCVCHSGISGRDCTVCSHGFILTEYGCKSCEDECTGVLLNELFEMKVQLQGLNISELPRLPWGYLQQMTEKEKALRPKVDAYQKVVADGKELIDNFTFYFNLESQADGLLVRAMDFSNRASRVSENAKETLHEAEKLFLELNKIWRSIKDLASELDKHGLDLTGPGLSTERMLIAAEKILQELKDRNFLRDKENAERELRKAHSLIDKINKLTRDRGHIDDLQKKLDLLENLLKITMQKINDDVRKPVDRATETTRGSRLRLNEVQDALSHVGDIVNSCNSTLKEAANILSAARGFAIDAAIKFEYLPRLLGELQNASNTVEERRGLLSSLNPPYKQNYVIPCQNHAEALERQSKQLEGLFVATKELSEFPLQAANAYQNIIDAINAAEKAAMEAEKAAENAYNQAYPETYAETQKAKNRSLQLLAEAQRLNEEDVPELDLALRSRKQDLAKLSDDIAYGKRKNDIINRDLDALPTGSRGELREAKAKILVADEIAKLAKDKADRLDMLITNEIKPRYEAIHAGTVGGLENLTRIIQKAREDIKGASRLADSADATSSRVRKHNAQLQLNLKDLKDKILLARQKASSIRVAVTTDDNKKCFRSYKPLIEPSTTNNIILNFAIGSGTPDSLLFFLGSSREEDFMAIEMFNRKIRFLWNAGGGTHIIQHNMTIETNDNQLLNNEKWFKIEVNRIGNLASLSVKRTRDGQRPDQHEVSGASAAGFTKMDLDSSSNLFIGGFPDNYLAPSDLFTSSFAGCLYTVELDGQSIGLWNFLSNVGCQGCKEGATEDIDISAYEMHGGSSYAIVPQNPYYRKSDAYNVVNFKTLNENALLFFSCNSKTGDFMSLELKKGKVVYQLRFGGRSQIYLETKKQYNNGKWIRVEAAREKFDAQILVEDELLEEKDVRHGSSSLDLRDSPIYYGGVPPNFTKEIWAGVVFKSFFGCLRDLQMDSTPVALSSGSFYGMTVGCSDRAIKVCNFLGGGYLELEGQTLTSDSSFSFSFLTHQRNALLMFSASKGQGKKTDNSETGNYYSISLKDGRIEVRISSDSVGEISMVSDNILSSAVFHTVTFICKNRRLLLSIDDVQEADFRLAGRFKEIVAPKKGGLFFGGSKSTLTTEPPLVGIIQDVIFNDRLLRFDKAVDYKNVDFGFADVQSLSEDIFQQMSVSEDDDDESCGVIDKSFDKEAFNPSNSKQGYFTTDIRNDLSKSFNISLEFRTHYPEGLLFLMKNEAKKQDLVIYLRNDTVVLEIRRKNYKRTMHSKLLERGRWNKVELMKSPLKMVLRVNEHVSSSDSVKKFSFKSPLLIGGVPRKFSLHNSEIPRTFYGCIKNLHINNEAKHLPTTPCFKHSERGSYFSGERFVIWNSAYYLSNTFVVQLEFRTESMSGDLIYISSSHAKIFFRLEVVDNQVLATLYSETDMQKIQLSRSLEEGPENEKCVNQWHSVEFSYKHGNMTLQVDDMKPVDKLLNKSLLQLNYVEVFIGGSPKSYSKYTAKNYIGCMKNIFINDEPVDFRNAEDSQDILFSCPG